MKENRQHWRRQQESAAAVEAAVGVSPMAMITDEESGRVIAPISTVPAAAQVKKRRPHSTEIKIVVHVIIFFRTCFAAQASKKITLSKLFYLTFIYLHEVQCSFMVDCHFHTMSPCDIHVILFTDSTFLAVAYG